MPSLDQLRTKWFLNFDSPQVSFPNAARHMGTNVMPWTDGNMVTPLIDGQEYMEVWHDIIKDLVDEGNAHVFHSAWKLNRVRTLGESFADSDALKVLIDPELLRTNVQIFPLICSNTVNFHAGNGLTTILLNLNGVENACLDSRYPTVVGSNHPKFAAFIKQNPPDSTVILGSIDIAKERWDRRAHLPSDPERPKEPTHDAGVLVQGPAVSDLAWSFIERWNDSSRERGLSRIDPTNPLLPINPIVDPPPEIHDVLPSSPDDFTLAQPGPHSIQVLHTYGKIKPGQKKISYSWANDGEFSAWASYLNAIQISSSYIYIEDQYFFPFSYPPMIDEAYNGTAAQESDIVFQLGKAIERGVRVAVIVPLKSEDPVVAVNQEYQRRLATHYLRQIANGAPGDFVVAFLTNGDTDDTAIYVHAKLMICDDEFVSIGSINISQRSITHDSELQIGIVDADNEFARDFRLSLWQEHAGQSFSDDPEEAFNDLKNLIEMGPASSNNKLREYPSDDPGPAPKKQATRINKLIDPYRGPDRNEVGP